MSPLLKMKPGCRTSPRVLVWRGEATAVSSAACGARAQLLEHACVWARARATGACVCVCVRGGHRGRSRSATGGWMDEVRLD